MQQIRLIVGLGNPGAKHHLTRHNIGFDYIDDLAQTFGTQLCQHSKFHGHVGQIQVGAHSVKLIKPMTFMNLSGQSVLALCQFHKIEPEHILVVHDELDLPPGITRLKSGGGHGGHNGLRNIIDRFGGRHQFHRLRIGIGHPGHKSKVLSHVLTKASADDYTSMLASYKSSFKFIPMMIEGQFQKVMQELHQIKFEAVKK